MNDISLVRRVGLVVLSLAIAGMLFRGSIASALIARGDDALRAGDGRRAFTYYERATIFDAASGVAADRWAFHLASTHDIVDARQAVVVADAALRIRSHDGALYADRALAEQELRQWTFAERDFSLAARFLHDARYEQLSGKAALLLGKPAIARWHFTQALRDDPSFAPARRALRSMARP